MSALAAALAELRAAQADVAFVEQRTWTGALANKTSHVVRAAAYSRERRAWAALDALATANPRHVHAVPGTYMTACSTCGGGTNNAKGACTCGIAHRATQTEAVALPRKPLDPNAPIDDAAECRLPFHRQEVRRG